MGRPDANTATELLCEIGKRMYDRGYVVVNDGNISVRTGENELWVTPSGVSKGRMTPDMMVRVDLEGNILSGNRYPSSEIKMHLKVYEQNPGIGGVVHAHPPCGSVFAVCRRPLDRWYMPEMLVGLGPVPVAEFAMPSTDAVPESIVPYVKDYNAVLLANHGALTWGTDLWQAFDRLEALEFYAKITMNIEQMGGGTVLSENDAQTVLSLAGKYRRLASERK